MESSNNSIDKPAVTGANLTRQQTLSISPELFEKLYLSPKNAVKGGLRNTFANPTPLYVHLFPIRDLKMWDMTN